MAERTGIEWTHHTFNPWSGCAKVSAGCANCYAANLPPAMRRNAAWGASEPRVAASDAYWRHPIAWSAAAEKAGERRRVFCASVADVFEDRDDLDLHRERLFALIEETPGLDWLLLTKRPEAVQRRTTRWGTVWPANVWLGTSVEDQRAADERIGHALRVDGPRVRFLSMEPLLGPVQLGVTVGGAFALFDHGAPRRAIDWVIVGGESGHRARPMHPAWVRSLRDQCAAAGVAFFFKQWGEWAPSDAIEAHGTAPRGWHEDDPRDGGRPVHTWPDAEVRAALRRLGKADPTGTLDLDTHVYRIGKVDAGRLLDGVTHHAFPAKVSRG